jgi:hypothetical protein
MQVKIRVKGEKLFGLFVVLLFGTSLMLTGCNQQMTCSKTGVSSPRWTAEQANRWYSKQGWVAGCNFTPSTAINQIEMWQEQDFDPETIDTELGWAEDIGFNSVRVYLHYLVWARNPTKMKERMDKFLDIADSHDITVMFVLFDDCWNPNPTLGKQPDPKLGIHNSGWVQCPGGEIQNRDKALYPVLKAYTQDLLRSFGRDKRILAWDLYNEPGNNEYFDKSLPLLKKVFEWARQVNPSQPITVGLWGWDEDFPQLNKVTIENSDIITFHHYNNAEHLKKKIKEFKSLGRPMLCTEYMARTRDCTFESHMLVFKKENIGCFNWGLVSGKTQTIFQWDTPGELPEPDVWFHDIFRRDGTAFDPEEIKLIKRLTSKN